MMSNLSPLSAIRLFRDERYAGALWGSNFHDGESEFMAVGAPYGEHEAKEAAGVAANKLERRLNISHLKLPRIFEGEDVDQADRWKY